MDELQFQSQVIKSVQRDNGYGLKLSNKFKAGVPDLLLFLPGFHPVLAEAKWLGEVKPGFNRKIDATELQRHHLATWQMAYTGDGPVAVLLIGAKFDCKVIYRVYDRRVTHATFDSFWRERELGCYFNMRQALMNIGVPSP